jgi:predicted HTH transcriptional regulator
MTTDELEALLDGAEETDRIEFKAAMEWDKNSLVKDILAMANVQDGGRIIIGVKEKDQNFEREGMSAAQIATFKIDDMRDQVAPYADPQVIFRIEQQADRKGLQYIVIDVSPFDEFPVICKRDGNDVQAGTIYYRSRAQKPQSARVSNHSDLRDIIERSIARRMQSMRRLGFTAPQAKKKYDFDAELGGL